MSTHLPFKDYIYAEEESRLMSAGENCIFSTNSKQPKHGATIAWYNVINRLIITTNIPPEDQFFDAQVEIAYHNYVEWVESMRQLYIDANDTAAIDRLVDIVGTLINFRKDILDG